MSFSLPSDLTEEQLQQMLDVLKKHGKVPPGDGPDPFKHPQMVIPKLPNFSGELPVPKGEVGFEVWKFEISCLLKDGLHQETAVTQGARKSLRGEAASILMNSLGHKATVHEILDKFEGIYGTVETGEELLQQFYNASQSPGESIASWGCRLEDLLNKAVVSKKFSPATKNEMLHSKFWMGLHDSALKNASRYKYETIEQFDELRREVRKLETEFVASATHTRKGVRAQQHMHVTDLGAQLEKLSSRLGSMEAKLEGLASREQQHPDKDKLLVQLNQTVDTLVERIDRLEASSSSQSYQSHPGRGRGRSRGGYNRGNYNRGSSYSNDAAGQRNFNSGQHYSGTPQQQNHLNY